MLTIIPAKPEITKTTVEVIQAAQPRKFILELDEQKMKLLVALQARMFCDDGFITHRQWSNLDDEFFQNKYPEDQTVKGICKWVNSKK